MDTAPAPVAPSGDPDERGEPAKLGDFGEPGDSGEPSDSGGPGDSGASGERTESGEPVRTFPTECPSIGVPAIPTRSDQDPPPVPVPSIAVPDVSSEPAPVPSVPRRESATGEVTADPLTAASTNGPAAARPEAAARRPAAAAHDRIDETADALTASSLTPPAPDDESFTPSVRSRLRSYVYLLVDPRSGRPFFAGCGQDDRCFDHVQAARNGSAPTRSPGAAAGMTGGVGQHDEFPELERIRRIEASGRRVRVDILRYGLEPDEAATVGAAAHDLLGLTGDPPAASQRRPAAEVGLLLTKRAKFKRAHQVVLLRVGPSGTDASYERVRHGWRIGRRWVDVTAPRAPHWAVVVVGELVDSVYRLDHWQSEEPGAPGSAPGGTRSRPAERYSFVGTRDPELERRYVGKSAAPYLRSGPVGSVAYVWSGPHWVNAGR